MPPTIDSRPIISPQRRRRRLLQSGVQSYFASRSDGMGTAEMRTETELMLVVAAIVNAGSRCDFAEYRSSFLYYL